MATLTDIAPFEAELTAIRRDLHAHPEVGLDTPRTAAVVADALRRWGADVVTGVGGHGVVATVHGATPGPVVGLRADMDALPIEETADVPWRSLYPGRMHACGHDGHTAMLLGAARFLCGSRGFSGTARFVFQPGEEGCGGALAMLADGLFERGPCDVLYGLHNRPGLALGRFDSTTGPAMAGGAFFDVEVEGVGAHAATPEDGVDAILAAAQIVQTIQAIKARGLSALKPAVLSVTRIEGGDAYNVMPDAVRFAGTARWLQPDTATELEDSLRRVVANVAAAFGASARVAWRPIFEPLVNDGRYATRMADAAADLVGEDLVERRAAPVMICEDFSYMLRHVPGAHIHLGIGDTADLHNPAYRFDDAAIAYGAALYSNLVEREARS